jgi:hypothetical protein
MLSNGSFTNWSEFGENSNNGGSNIFIQSLSDINKR